MPLNSGLYFESNWYWLPICLLVGAGYSALLYYREGKIARLSEKNSTPPLIMAVMRFLCVSMVAILLMSPFIKIRMSKVQKPAVVILNDVSESVKNSFAKGDSAELRKQIEKIKNQLLANFEVHEFSFSDKIHEKDIGAYSGKATNISAALTEVNDRFLNRNLGAVLLISDGIYNQGENPVYAHQNYPAAIFTVALGDTTLQRDLKIAQVAFNKKVNLNQQIPLKVEVEATNLSGKTADLKVFEVIDSQTHSLLYNKLINIGSQQNFQSIDILLNAQRPGVIHYKISLSQLEGEATYRNNERDVFIEVLENKEKILILYYAPHPDVAALKRAIETNRAFEVKTAGISDFNQPLSEYNLLIAHQIPSQKNKAQAVLTQAIELKKPILFVLGSQTSYNDLKAYQQVVEITASPNKTNEATAQFNPDFSSFTLQKSTIEAISKLPPLSVTFGNFKTLSTANVLMFQTIHSVKTNFPMIAISEQNTGKQAVICGEGLWRWRLYDFLQNKSHQATNELISKLVQLLCVKEDKRPFVVMLPKNIFNENEQVNFDARLLNNNFELVNEPEVEMVLQHNSGQSFTFKFTRNENAYSLNAGNLPIGQYTFSAKTTLGGKNLSASGKFSVVPLQLETSRTRADWELLTQLAAKHNGTMYTLQNMHQSAESIAALPNLKPVIFDTYLTESAIHLKWIFAILAFLLCAEWFYRKFMGAY
jgi:hypothetical protein